MSSFECCDVEASEFVDWDTAGVFLLESSEFVGEFAHEVDGDSSGGDFDDGGVVDAAVYGDDA